MNELTRGALVCLIFASTIICVCVLIITPGVSVVIALVTFYYIIARYTPDCLMWLYKKLGGK